MGEYSRVPLRYMVATSPGTDFAQGSAESGRGAGKVIAELDRRGTKAEAIMLDDEARPERVVVRAR
jgi:hypothetical protein